MKGTVVIQQTGHVGMEPTNPSHTCYQVIQGDEDLQFSQEVARRIHEGGLNADGLTTRWIKVLGW